MNAPKRKEKKFFSNKFKQRRENTRSTPNRMDIVRSGVTGLSLPSRGLVTISIDRIHDNPINERKTFANMEGLIASIREKGIIEPPAAIPHPVLEGHVQLVTGSRRFRAAKELKFETFTVNLTPVESTEELRIKSLISNIQREDVPPLELAEALQSLLNESETVKTQRELARRLGKDETWVSGMLRILTMPDDLREKLGTSQTPVGYETAVRIARVNDEKAQEELIDAAVQGATHREIREKIETVAPKMKSNHRQKIVHTIKLETATVTIHFRKPSISVEDRIAVLEDALAIEKGKLF